MSKRSFTLKQTSQRPIILVQGLVLTLLLLGLSQYNSSLGAIHTYAFVSLQNIFFTFFKLLETSELWLNMWGILKKTGIGFILGSISELFLGILLAYSKVLNALVSPLFNSIRQVPLLCLTSLLPWLTVFENIHLALVEIPLTREERNLRVNEHIEIVGLKGFEKAYPHELPDGMAQRVAIARGLVNNPDILLLDEPFDTLDAIHTELLTS